MKSSTKTVTTTCTANGILVIARIPAGFILNATIAVSEVRIQLKPNVTAVSDRFAPACPLLDSPRPNNGRNASIPAAIPINARMMARFTKNICELICRSLSKLFRP